MLNATILEDKIFSLIHFVIISLLFYPLIGQSAVFNVTNEDELRDALSMAESNGEDDVINIGASLYRTFGEPFTFETDEDFSLTIEGEGAGITLLDGSRLSRVLIIKSNTGNATFSVKISGLTVQNGLNDSCGGDILIVLPVNGAGILIINSGFVTIEESEFLNNSVICQNGGGLSLERIFTEDVFPELPKTVVLNNNVFRDNLAGINGAGAEFFASNAFVSDNTFINNVSGTNGGALSVHTSKTFQIMQNFFSNNIADNFGGALRASGNVVELTENEFINNMVDRNGGGAYIEGEELSVNDNMFTYNSASSLGGGLYVSRGSILRMTDNLFVGNSTITNNGLGGGVYVKSEFIPFLDASVINNIFNDNRSGLGGGLFMEISTLVTEGAANVVNNTITQNIATIAHGGVSIVLRTPPPPPPTLFPTIPPSINTDRNGKENNASENSRLKQNEQELVLNIYNNIIYDNFATGEGQDLYLEDVLGSINLMYIDLFNNDFSSFYSFCENSPTCRLMINKGNNIDQDPLFVDAEAADFSLLPDSPCIDAGDPDAPDVPDIDIYGNPRVPPPDMGAVEFIQMVVDGEGGGGCSIAGTPVTSSLAVFLVVPVLLIIRRFVNRYRR